MRYNIRERDIELLKLMVNEVEQYSLPKVTHNSYRTILRSLKHLGQMGFCFIIRREPCSKGGKDKNIWLITEKGRMLLKLLEKEAK
jgi:predicted transcriptional regulator